MSFTRKDTSRCRNRRREGDDHRRRHIIVIIIGVTNIGLHRLRITDVGRLRTINAVRLGTGTDRHLRTGTDRLRPVTDIRRRRRIASATCLRLLARL